MSNYYNQSLQQPKQKQDRAYDWGDTITADVKEFIVLPDGDYDFIVDRFERGQFEGSEKMPACPTAILYIKIDTPLSPESVIIRHQLMLHSKVEWKLSEFFAAIGQKKKGQPLQMNWQLVPGARGKCKLGARQYNGNMYNEIKQFYPAPGYEGTTGGVGFTPNQF